VRCVAAQYAVCTHPRFQGMPSTQQRQVPPQLAHLGLKVAVHGTRHMLYGAWEQVSQQPHEDGGVVGGQLSKVEVSQCAQQDLVLCSMASEARHASLSARMAALGSRCGNGSWPACVHQPTRGPPRPT